MSGADWFEALQEFALIVFGPTITLVAILAVATALLFAVLILLSSFFTSNT